MFSGRTWSGLPQTRMCICSWSLRQSKVSYSDIHFVDDQVAHLESAQGLGVNCYLAAYGYTTEKQVERARGLGIKVLEEGDLAGWMGGVLSVSLSFERVGTLGVCFLSRLNSPSLSSASLRLLALIHGPEDTPPILLLRPIDSGSVCERNTQPLGMHVPNVCETAYAGMMIMDWSHLGARCDTSRDLCVAPSGPGHPAHCRFCKGLRLSSGKGDWTTRTLGMDVAYHPHPSPLPSNFRCQVIR